VTGTLEKIEDEDDRAEVYTRRSSIGKLIAGSGFRELIRLRNQAARQLTIGDRRFEDYFSFQMYLQGLDEAKLADFYQRVLKGTELAYSANLQGLKDQFGNKVLYPYNIPYFEKRSERFGLGRSDASAYIPQGKIRSIAVETMKGIGLDFGAPPLGKAIVDIENRPGKYPAMQIYAAEAHGDVRVSVPARLDSWTAEREMLCGLGEATYYASCVKSPSSLLAALRKYQALANACGDIAGSLIYDPEWWDRYTALPDSLLSKLSGRLRFDHLSDVRKTIVAALFEKEIYRNPDADFDQIWWNLAEKHLKLRRVEDEDGNLVSEWGLFPELFGQPLRLQNGVLGCIAAAQIRTRLERDNKSVVGNPKTGSFLIEKMCGYGLDLNWEEVLQTATGEPLDPNFLIEKLTR
jgi:peptidyl-dipeptidase A